MATEKRPRKNGHGKTATEKRPRKNTDEHGKDATKTEDGRRKKTNRQRKRTDDDESYILDIRCAAADGRGLGWLRAGARHRGAAGAGHPAPAAGDRTAHPRPAVAEGHPSARAAEPRRLHRGSPGGDRPRQGVLLGHERGQR